MSKPTLKSLTILTIAIDSAASGWSPLSEAGYAGNMVMVQLLLEKGADVNHKDTCETHFPTPHSTTIFAECAPASNCFLK